MKRFLRYLRIAFSATCLIACVLLIALWVLSYWYVAIYAGPRIGTRLIRVGTMPGACGVGIGTYHSQSIAPYTVLTQDADEWWSMCEPTSRYSRTWGFFDYEDGNLTIPYWFAVLFAVTLAPSPWIRIEWRFKLRTLLIATTLVAVVLGLFVYAAKK